VVRARAVWVVLGGRVALTTTVIAHLPCSLACGDGKGGYSLSYLQKGRNGERKASCTTTVRRTKPRASRCVSPRASKRTPAPSPTLSECICSACSSSSISTPSHFTYLRSHTYICRYSSYTPPLATQRIGSGPILVQNSAGSHLILSAYVDTHNPCREPTYTLYPSIYV